jgi:hypothetical protein
MTLAEAGEIFAYWAENPPTHVMVQIIARILGWKPSVPADDTNVAELMAAPPPGIAITPGGTLDMPQPVFDRDALRERNRARAAVLARRNVPKGASGGGEAMPKLARPTPSSLT